jgi:hypothetical protein
MGRSHSTWWEVAAGLGAGVACGLVYGFVHAALTNAVLHDPYQPSPGMAA